ncbi:Transcriptional regulator, IclR family [Cupriavidus taiwanensis]|uniref:Transcriptional regulator, IclR family n=1 Tax=Cupriavidus taiwanensis TaxID=164546 RepID=A0A375IL31_9BURK|nr:IclR family transcriptional regulator [Cupriavidus taiwanensis]SOY63571.1 Transcriptional regulator, IclR family [Cupriavidus taiwanensis]SOY63572.1 Transcriptional regulator, IclR family [Cupriavidus taiwanensis]SOY93738.1 Transcriptional regulator, IclR family [Cupriavidus taiwanensis]SOZ26993.1 Transcriptional regulator, IclR family [Cupriavidus taiwanensis]SOZ64480.1 Transcriptional regulator, IclR family [Cupriavidus taiwanensis]
MPTVIPAASRAMAVFEVFAREKRELSNSDMARLLSLPESSTSDLLHTLHSLGYLMRTSRTRRFYPTGRLFEVARQIAENDPLSTVAQEAVEQVSARTNESVFFGVLDSNAVKVVAVQASRLPLRYIIEVGYRASLHASALGKGLLGLLPPEEARATLAKSPLRAVTEHTIVDADVLMDQIAQGRERGWYEAHEEGSEGVHGLAVAGWLGGQPAGISLAGPAERMRKHHDAYLAALMEVRDGLMAER